MDTALIIQHISKHISLDAIETDFFISLLQFRNVKKKELLIREGDIVRHEHFVLKGCFKSYSVDDKGDEHIIMFAPEDWWMGDLYSFLTERPSRFYTEAIEDSEIAFISKTNLQRLYEEVPKFERFFRILFQNALVAQFQRIDQNLSMTADEKYLQFRQKYPQLEQRLPQKQIAAFLGITPEFLSMVRRKIANG
jgi:CRP-like cAMP-binding protein